MSTNFKKINKQKGAAMFIAVICFLFISLAIISGLVVPTVREYKNSRINLNSKKSFFLSESGTEDAIYRIKNSMTIGTNETIILDSNSATTTITSISSTAKEINTVGDVADHERTTNVTMSTVPGVSFNYGIQVGQGGVYLEGSGTVNGNIYANGPITGDSSAIITGTAISANSPALAADQQNGSGTPSNNVNFGNANGTQDITQSFQVSTESPLNKVQFYLRKTSTPGNATVRIVNDNGGNPGTTVIASGTLSASTVTSTYGWVEVSFTTNPILDIGTTYWVVIDGSTNSSRYYTIGASPGSYANGLGKIGQYSGTWNNTSPSGLDYFFKIYLGGVTGLIAGTSGSQWNQLHVGTVSGSAQANTVNYTNATGNIYCQSGTGNNKSCTSQVDPIYITFPVSDGNMEDWKEEAAAGGTHVGNYSVGFAGATIGPRKITGNLTISGGGTLTVTGTLWVTGNIILDGGARVRLDSGYGTNDGVLIADGTISISGGGQATGSGSSGSYIMMLSTSTSTSAISVSGGAGAVIVYAANGTVNISGGAALKEAIGYRMVIGGGSSITYETGLANSNFSSGASGDWAVGEWKETE
jgi:hypothetical protein